MCAYSFNLKAPAPGLFGAPAAAPKPGGLFGSPAPGECLFFVSHNNDHVSLV